METTYIQSDLINYNNFKEQYPGYLFLFDNGDIYKMYKDDAVIAADVLDIKPIDGIVSVNRNDLKDALLKLIRNGHKAAVCDKPREETKKTIEEITKKEAPTD